MTPQDPASDWAQQLDLAGVTARGPKTPMWLGRQFAKGTPKAVTLREYLKATLPGEATAGDYVKEAASNAFGMYIEAFGSAGQNLLELALPESVEKAWGINRMSEEMQGTAREIRPPSADVAAHGGTLGKFFSQDIAGAAGTMAAFSIPGLAAGRLAALAGATRGGVIKTAMKATGAFGAASQSELMYNDILRQTGDESAAWKGYFAGLGIGATQAIDIPLLMGMNKKTGGFLKDILVHGALGSAAMGTQQAATEGVYAALTDEERNALGNILRAVVTGGVVGSGARGVGRFADNFSALNRGATGELMDQLRQPGIPHEERVKSAAPWESVDADTRSVVDEFLRTNESETLSEKQKDDMRRTVVTQPSTPMETFISEHVAKRGGKTVFISHPGEPWKHPSSFDPKSGTVVIDSQAAPQAVLASFWAHETGHLFAETNPEAFREFMGNLEKDAPDLVRMSRERRIAAEPDGAWQLDPGSVQGETFGQLSQDLGGLIYMMETDPKFMERAIQGPGKHSIVRLGDAVINGLNKMLGGKAKFATFSERQINAIREINQLMTGVSISPKEALPVAKEIVDRWRNLIGQTYAYAGGLAQPGMTEPSPGQQGPTAPRSSSYERERQGTGVPGIEPQVTTFSPGQRRPGKTGMSAEPPGGPEDVLTGATAVAPGAAAPLFPEGGPEGAAAPGAPVEVQAAPEATLSPEETVQVELGSEHAWMARVLESYKAKKESAAKPAEPAAEVSPAKPGQPLKLPKIAPTEPLVGAEKSSSSIERDRPATEPDAASSAPLAEEMGIMAEAEPNAEESAAAEADSEARRLRTQALSGDLDVTDRKRSLELYANTPDGRGMLTTLASGGLKAEDAANLQSDIQADLGFKVSRIAAAGALRGAKALAPTQPKNYPTITLEADHPDFKPVSKIVNTFFKDQRIQSALLVWRNLRDTRGSQKKQVMEILSEAAGVKDLTDSAIQHAIEQIAENKARGLRPSFKAGASGRLQMAAFNSYRDRPSLEHSPYMNERDQEKIANSWYVMGGQAPGVFGRKVIAGPMSEAGARARYEVAAKAYNDALSETIKNATWPPTPMQFAAFNPYAKGDTLLGESSSERAALRELSSKWNETLFDDFTAMRRVTDARKRGESTDVSLKETAYWGRIGAKQEYTRRYVQKPVMEYLAKAGIDVLEDTKTLPSFDTYLLRRAADKYQAAVDKRSAMEPELAGQGKAGKISKEEAAKIREEASLLSPKDREAFLEKAYARREEQLRIKKGSGLSKEEIAAFDRQYPQLPRGVQQAYEKAADLVYRMTAEGRKWLVEHGNMTQGASDAWHELFGREYVPHLTIFEPDSQFTPIGDGFQVPARLFERVRGRTSRPYSPTVAVFNQAMQRAIVSERNRVGRSLGELVRTTPDEKMWMHFDNHADIPEKLVETGRVFRYMENGKKQWVGFTGPDGKRMADAMRRLNIHSAGMFEVVRPLTRWVMNMATSWNVFFSVGNLSRDVLTAMASSGAEVDKAFAMRVAKGAPHALRVAMHAAEVPGVSKLFGKISLEEAADFKRFSDAGGRTGIVELQTYGNRMRRIQAEFKRYAGSKNPAHIRQHVSNFVSALEDFNGAFEQATRYSAWKEAKTRGMSDDAAAAMAKKISVNFNKRGTIAPSLGALYAFSSASLAGLHRFGTVVGTRRGAALAGGLAALGFMESLFNRSMAGEDEDGENSWKALNDYEKARSFSLSAGGTSFFGFPMPWGWNLPVYLGVLAEHAFSDGLKPAEFAKRLILEAIENVNPIGGQTLAQALTPTAGRFATEIGQNVDPFGRPIRPEPTPFDYATPNYEQYFQSVSPTAKYVAHQLAMIGGDEVKPGPLDLSPEDIEHAASFMVGGATRNAYRFATILSDTLTGDASRIGSLPGARYFVHSPSPEGRAMRFHDTVKGAETSKQLIDRAVESGDAGLIEKTVTEEGGMASLSDATQAMQKAYSQLRKALATAPESDKAELQDAMDEIQKVARTMKMEMTKK